MAIQSEIPTQSAESENEQCLQVVHHRGWKLRRAATT